MDGQYNIPELLQAAFGAAPGIVFIPPSKPSLNQLEQWVGVNAYRPQLQEEIPMETKQSWLGTPIVFPMKFIGANNYKTFDEGGKIRESKYGSFDLPAATLVDFEREKAIVESQPRGAYGDVDELFAIGSWRIRMRGLCLNEPGVRTAAAQKKSLFDYDNVLGPIEVEGYLFSVLNISSIVIKRTKFGQIEGKPWVIPFEIEAKSKIPAEVRF